MCGGVGGVSDALKKRGFHPGPVIDLSRSEQCDITSGRVLDWACTTFSCAAHPACRCYAVPLGFDRLDPKTKLGNSTAFACFIVFLVAVRCKVPALLEQPRLSKMRWLPIWRWLLTLPGVSESFLASCAYGARYKKEFGLLGHLLDLDLIHRKCPGGHQHLRVEGSITKQSAIYHPKVAAAFARVISSALLASPPPPDPAKPGLESVAVNDMLFGLHWSVSAVWAWRQQAHINVLEAFKHAVLKGGDRKLVLLLDSSPPDQFCVLGELQQVCRPTRAERPQIQGPAVVAGRWNAEPIKSRVKSSAQGLGGERPRPR